jgi:hypothetical protein
MEATRYFLFRSFRAALIITATAAWVTIFAIRKVGVASSSAPDWHGHFAYFPYVFAYFPYVTSGVTVLVLSWWILSGRERLEKWFISIWLAIVLAGWLPQLHFSRALLLSQVAQAILAALATFVAIKITVDIARPLYREARLEREAREKG